MGSLLSLIWADTQRFTVTFLYTITIFPLLLDAPQVQCIRMYKARENDELALEKADIIMVMQYSNDGEQNEQYLKLWLASYVSSIKLLTAQSSFRRSFLFVVAHLKE